MSLTKVIAVVGATASGKTALGIELAERLGGEIVCADSMQIYRGMDIATAKPTPEERRRVRHHMTDFLDVNESYSVARYVSDAGECISDIAGRGRVPIIVGGTGLYVDSLITGVRFEEIPGDGGKTRGALRERMKSQSAQTLLDELTRIDPETASALHVNNRGRIVRALEVYELTGETMSELKRKSRLGGRRCDALYIGISFSDRQKLYDRINLRVDCMIRGGLVEEAKRYASLSENTTARQAIGYKELKPYLDGVLTLDEAAENLKRSTRRYAKRQMTWFRRNKDIFYVYPDSDENFAETAYQKARSFLAD